MRLSQVEDKILRREGTKLKKKFLVHATTEDKLPSIREKGLLPRKLAGCYVWGDERIPYGAKPEEVLRCRPNNIYFWDDLYEGIGQALATVAYLKKGDPAIVIVDVGDIRDKLKLDFEVHRWGPPEEEEPTSYMYEGTIPPEKIICTCHLSEEYKPDTGKVACPMIHEPEECPNYNVETLIEEFNDTSKWVCKCKL